MKRRLIFFVLLFLASIVFSLSYLNDWERLNFLSHRFGWPENIVKDAPGWNLIDDPGMPVVDRRPSVRKCWGIKVKGRIVMDATLPTYCLGIAHGEWVSVEDPRGNGDSHDIFSTIRDLMLSR